jgi:hypothetical protein
MLSNGKRALQCFPCHCQFRPPFGSSSVRDHARIALDSSVIIVIIIVIVVNHSKRQGRPSEPERRQAVKRSFPYVSELCVCRVVWIAKRRLDQTSQNNMEPTVLEL